MLRQAYIITSTFNIMIKILNSKLVIISEYQNTKRFLQNATNQIGQKIFFLIKKVKNKVPWTHIISNLNGEKIRETFYDKELPKNKLNKV